MSIIGPNGDKCLEPGPLACTRLLLQGHNPQNLVLEGCPPEKVSDGQRKEIDLQGPDFRVLDQATQLGDRDPLLILSLTSESSMASTPTPTPTPTPATTSAPDAAAKSSSEATEASHSRAPRVFARWSVNSW